MFFELLLFIVAGTLLGVITGLTPGLHVNTMGAMLLSIATTTLDPILIATIVISMAISHTIFDFIPSVFLGAPDPETALSVLPGHKLFLEGKGLEAIYLTVIGGLGAVAATLVLFIPLLYIIPAVYSYSKPHIHLLLIIITSVMVLSEKGSFNKAMFVLIFMLSGFLGMVALNSAILPGSASLFPIFTGLFGISGLLYSLERKAEAPEQETTIQPIPKKIVIAGIFKGLFSGSIVGTLPGVGAAQATVISQEITRRKGEKEFLISIGAINTIVALFSIISLYTILKPRSGAAVIVESVIDVFGYNELLLALSITLISTGISTIMILKMMKTIMKYIQKIDHTKLTKWIMVFLIVLTLVMTGFPGLFILLVSTSIGLLAPLYGVKRSSLMGVLMLPLIFFYASLYMII